MLVRLLQKFDAFEFDPSAQPQDSLPPASWKNKPGRQGRERIFPKMHLTMYSYVGQMFYVSATILLIHMFTLYCIQKGLWMRLREAHDDY